MMGTIRAMKIFRTTLLQQSADYGYKGLDRTTQQGSLQHNRKEPQ